MLGSSTSFTPGVEASRVLTSSGLIVYSVSIVIASECTRMVGIHTVVHKTWRSGASKIFFVSQHTFISSLVLLEVELPHGK